MCVYGAFLKDQSLSDLCYQPPERQKKNFRDLELSEIKGFMEPLQMQDRKG